MATGDVTLKIQHNDSTTSDQMYWIAFYEDGNLRGGIDSEVVYDPFTGSHPTSIDESTLNNIRQGMILSSTGNVIYRQEGGISNAWVESTVTSQPKDKAIVGVYNKPSAWGVAGNYSPTDAQLHTYNALGEGQILVTDAGGNIETGDYICSSDRYGHGMRQDDDLLHNYTVAKATEALSFDSVPVDPELGYKSILIACTYHCG